MKTEWMLIGLIFTAFVYGQSAGAPPVPMAGNVTLPVDDYNQLVELAARATGGVPRRRSITRSKAPIFSFR